MKIKDIVFAYCEDIKYEVKEHTYWIYIVMARRIEDYLEITQETPKNYLNEYLAKKNLSYSSKRMIKSLINRSLDFAQKSGLFDYKHRITLKLQPNCVRKVEALTKNEQKKLEDYIIGNKKIHLYGIIISLYTGLRIGELMALKWEDVNLTEKYIYVKRTICSIAGKDIVDLPKSHCSMRKIPLSKHLIPLFFALKTYSKGEFVIQNKIKQKTTVRSYQQSFGRVLKKLKIKHYGFHSLRHTFANRLMNNRIDIKTISELMGHNSASITLQAYIHTSDLQKNMAVSSLCPKMAG